MSMNDEAWAPQACTLPTVDQPLRLAEFDDLFTTALQRQERISPTGLRWDLDPAAEETARDLAGRRRHCGGCAGGTSCGCAG